MPNIVKSNFIGKFKVGDNINYNLRILKSLYASRENGDGDEKRLVVKPITILIVSIIEAVLYDFHFRVNNFTNEGVQGLTDQVIQYIRGRKIDELEKYTASARKHELFGAGPGGIYDDLDTLRKLRNRVHIQNTKGDFEEDDSAAFSEPRMLVAEKTLETVLKTMAAKHPRRHDHVADFELPWNPHVA